MQDFDPTDEELIRRACLEADEAPFEKLVNRYSDQLVTHAIARCSPASTTRDIGFGKDVAQMTWIKVHRNRCKFEDDTPGSFRRWIFTINRNNALDACRHRGRLPDLSINDPNSPHPVSNDQPAIDNLDELEALRLCRESYRDDPQVETFIQCHFEGVTVKAIAEKREPDIVARYDQARAKAKEQVRQDETISKALLRIAPDVVAEFERVTSNIYSDISRGKTTLVNCVRRRLGLDS
ncbi:RNA polymerase sigma factor [Pirellulaceae bacterium SH449]